MSSSKSPTTYLFVDGSNLYGSQYELFGPGKYLHFSDFISQLQFSLNLVFAKIYFYASYSPTPPRPTDKQKRYLRNEQYFYRSVIDTPRTIFFKGYRSPTSGKEKEVDVKLAADIVDFAHRHKFEHMVIISGDADFIGALEKVQNLRLQVSVVCMQNNIMYRALIHYPTKIVTVDSFHPKINNAGIRNKPTYLQLNSSNIAKSLNKKRLDMPKHAEQLNKRISLSSKFVNKK